MRSRRWALTGATFATALVATMTGSAYAALVVGDAGDNDLVGTAGADTIRAKAGDDVVHARSGDDRILGGKGRDVLWGQGGKNVIDAGHDARRDVVHGGPNVDTLYLYGRDHGYGGDGNDVIYGTYATGAMEIWCGPGQDRVIFNQQSPGVAVHGCEHVQVVSAG